MSLIPPSLQWLPIESIDHAGDKACLCIAVSSALRCYVTEGGMVTHNSDTATAVDGLPERPRAFVDAMLSGMEVEEAARVAGLPVERIGDISRNIGRALANVWGPEGFSEGDALRVLAQRAGEVGATVSGERYEGGSAPEAPAAGTGPVPLPARSLATAQRSPTTAQPLQTSAAAGAAFYNHADRWLHEKLGSIAESAGLPELLTKFGEVTSRHVPFFREAVRVLKEQAVPNAFIVPEALALLKEMQVKAAFGREMALDVHRALDGKAKFTDLPVPADLARNPAFKKRLYLAMIGEVPMETLPPQHQQLATRLRAMLSEAGTEAVRQGRMSPDTLALLKEHYVPHYYEDDLKHDSIFRKAARLLGLQDILAQRTTAWHIIDSETKDPRSPNEKALIPWDDKGKRWRFKSQEHRDAFYTEFIKDATLGELKGRGDRLRSITREQLDRLETVEPETRGKIKEIQTQLRRRYEKRAPLTVEQQEQAGLIFDPIYSTVRYLAEMHRNNAVAGFFNAVAANPDWVTDTDTVGFRKLPDARSYGALAGRYVLDPIANQVEALAGDESPLMEIYDDLVRLWASGKTVWNPGTHVRNVLGNVPFSQLSGTNILNPTNWTYYRDAVKAIRNGGDSLKEMYEQGVLGGDFGSTELKAALRELLPDSSLMDDASETPTRLIARITKALFDKSTSKAGRGFQHTSAFVHAAYQFSDDAFKAAGFLKARAMGMDPKAAAAHVRTWYPYYDNIGSSSGIKFARRLFPFVSFFREAVRIFSHAVRERPLSLAGTMVLPYVFTQIALAALGLGDDDEKEVLKDMRGKLKFSGMTGDFPAFAMLLPFRMQGKLAQFDLSNVMPFAGFLGRPLETGQSDDWISYVARQLLTSGPAGNLLVGIGTNAEPFSGRNIVEDDMTGPEKAMARAKYVWSTLAPPLAGTSLMMMANATERSTNKTLEKRSLGQAVLRGLLGLDVRNASPDLYRLAEDFRKEHGLAADQAWSGGSTAQQRLRRELFSELVQDEPDLPAIARVLLSLEESGVPVKGQDDINKLLFYRNPIMVIDGKENQQKFRASLTGESRVVLEDALSEFARVRREAPRVIAEARRLMPRG